MPTCHSSVNGMYVGCSVKSVQIVAFWGNMVENVLIYLFGFRHLFAFFAFKNWHL